MRQAEPGCGLGGRVSVEERCGIELELLNRFDAFAREHSLTYWLFWGTLLGAVRHKGFIPWDDDIDVIMPQSDYLRFLQLMRESPNRIDNAYVNAFELDCAYTRPFAKLCDRRTVLYEDFDICYVEEGVYIDVFPLVPLSCDAREMQLLRRRWRKDFVLLGLSKGRLVPGRSFAQTAGKILLKPYAMLKGYRCFLEDMCVDIDSEKASFDDACFAICAEEETRVFEADWFKGTCYLEFEGGRFPAPVHHDAILEACYGDYMVPPPVEERKPHESMAYWKKEPGAEACCPGTIEREEAR